VTRESVQPGADRAAGDPWALAFWVALGLLFLLQVLGFRDLRHDDAYISYRYGQNLAEGQGFVFNPGERLMGSTAPGHALLAGALYPLSGLEGLPTWMAILGCAAWSAQSAALFLLLRPAIGVGWAAGVALSVGVGAAGAASWVALETHIPVACVLFSFVAALGKRWLWAASLVAIAGFFRPDAFLVALLLAPLCVRDLGFSSWRPALLGLALALPWFAFAWAYFGSPLPNSLSAKVQASTPSAYALHVAQHPAPLLLFASRPALHAGFWSLALVGAVFAVRREPGLWLLPAYAALHLATYVLLAPPPAHTWHLYPGAAIAVALAICALAAAGSWVHRGRQPLALPAAVLVGLLAAAHLYQTGEFAFSHRQAYWHGARDAAYRELADYLVANAEPSDRVASGEVGTIAYYSRLPIYDLVHLVSSPASDAPSDVRYWALPPGWGGVPDARRPIAAFAPGRFEVRLYTRRGPGREP